MATTTKRQIGTMDCLCCGHEIPVKAAESGTLNAACPWCDFPAYAKSGTEAHRIITGKLKGAQQQPAKTAPAPAARPAPAPVEPAPPPPAKRRVSTIFDLGAAA